MKSGVLHHAVLRAVAATVVPRNFFVFHRAHTCMSSFVRGIGRSLTRDPVMAALAVALVGLLVALAVKHAHKSRREGFWQFKGTEKNWPTKPEHREKVRSLCGNGQNMQNIQDDDKYKYLAKYEKAPVYKDCDEAWKAWKAQADKGPGANQAAQKECKKGPCKSMSLAVTHPCSNRDGTKCCKTADGKDCRPITEGSQRDKTVTESYNCKHSYATCKASDGDSKKCYWGDKVGFNKGKCCLTPYSGVCSAPKSGSGAAAPPAAAAPGLPAGVQGEYKGCYYVAQTDGKCSTPGYSKNTDMETVDDKFTGKYANINKYHCAKDDGCVNKIKDWYRQNKPSGKGVDTQGEYKGCYYVAQTDGKCSTPGYSKNTDMETVTDKYPNNINKYHCAKDDGCVAKIKEWHRKNTKVKPAGEAMTSCEDGSSVPVAAACPARPAYSAADYAQPRV